MKKEPDFCEWDKIEIGKKFAFERVLTKDDIRQYAELIQDFNPMHINEEYAKNTMYGGVISHGMLAASLFSTLLGMYCPGRDSIILSVDVKFRKPVLPDRPLSVEGEVTQKFDALKMLTISLSLKDEESILISGESKVKKF